MNANWPPGLGIIQRLWLWLRRAYRHCSTYDDYYGSPPWQQKVACQCKLCRPDPPKFMIPSYKPPPMGVIRVISTMDPVMREYRIVSWTGNTT